MSPLATPVLAAGAVCWRVVEGKVRVLLIHRSTHADFSLPKGKLDPGETLPETAVREIREETGLAVTLGAPLGTVEYVLPNGREKVVHYWSVEIDDHALELARFTPNDEIASLEWLPLAKARKKLTYEHDVAVLDRFAERFHAGNARTFAVIAVRHGTAVPAPAWDGPDATRPLMHGGMAQAAGIARGIAAFGPVKIVSSTAARCLATVGPLAELTGLTPTLSDEISQDAHEAGRSDVHTVVAKRLRKRKTVVLCTHGPVLPEIVAAIASAAVAPAGDIGRNAPLARAAALGTGDFSVLHLSREHPGQAIVAVETHSPA